MCVNWTQFKAKTLPMSLQQILILIFTISTQICLCKNICIRENTLQFHSKEWDISNIPFVQHTSWLMKEGGKYWTISEHFNASLKYVYYFMESLQKKKKSLPIIQSSSKLWSNYTTLLSLLKSKEVWKPKQAIIYGIYRR